MMAGSENAKIRKRPLRKRRPRLHQGFNDCEDGLLRERQTTRRSSSGNISLGCGPLGYYETSDFSHMSLTRGLCADAHLPPLVTLLLNGTAPAALCEEQLRNKVWPAVADHSTPLASTNSRNPTLSGTESYDRRECAKAEKPWRPGY